MSTVLQQWPCGWESHDSSGIERPRSRPEHAEPYNAAFPEPSA